MTGKEKAFISAYVDDVKRNATAAAIKAGYSKKTAPQTASRLMKKEHIAAEIKRRIEKLHEENTAQADEVVEFLTSVMRGEKVDNIPLYKEVGLQTLVKGVAPAKDRLRAAEMLGKYYGIFTDRTQLEGGDSPVVIINDLPRGEDNEDE